MKCSMITIHHIPNFGSVFQAYGLQKYLQQQGFDAEVIDYRPAYYDAGRNKLKTLVGKVLNLKPYLTRKKKFESFVKKYENLSAKRFVTPEQLQSHYGNSDAVFLAGGDQLWNNYHPCGNDDAYKLTFAKQGKKLAYGTSMGRDNFTADELKALSAKTADFQRIMLREKCTVDMLQTHTAVPVSHVIDPVGLLDAEDFRKIAKKPAMTEPYAVMYLADSSPLLDAAIELLSRKMGLKIVHICGFRKKCCCDYFVKDAGPEEILGYIANAEFVLSASFHATMFSLMFNKPFATLLPGEKTNARIEDLLKYVGLQNRILHNGSDLAVLEKTVDYTNPNEILKELQNASRELLLQTLGEMAEG